MGGPPRVATVVLNWNNWEDTQECLRSVGQLTYRPLEIYVVDNGSTDGSPELIRKAFPQIRLIRLPENRGYGGGMNAGIEAAMAAGHDHVICLNNDMTVDPGLLQPLVRAAAQGRVVPYPAIYQGDRPCLLDSAGNRLSFTGLTSVVAHGAREIPKDLRVDYTELPFLATELIDLIGGYKTEYFAFYEDVELNLRIRKAGWRLVLVPESKVFHRRGRTTRRVPGLLSYYSTRNRIFLARHHYSSWQSLLTLFHVLLLTLPPLIIGTFLNPDSVHTPRYLLLGLGDGLLPWRRGITREWRVPD